MSQNVIELNGKRYDAVTGAYLGKSHVIPKHITEHYLHGKVIDGFVRPQPAKKSASPKQPKQETVKPAETHKAKVTAAPAPKVSHVKSKIIVRNTANQAHTKANHLAAHRPEHSKTLVRRHVQKPKFTMKTAVKKAHAPSEVMAKPQATLTRKQSVYGINPVRRERAAATSKHHAVKHFTPPAIHSVSTAVPVIPVQPAPLQMSARPTVVAAKHHNTVFESAIARATSHEQPAHKVRRRRSGKRRLANSLAVMATFLIIGGFVSYLNLPGIQMRIASVQAGFGASLPTYAPTGYALQGDVRRSGSVITVSFRSGASQYRITQQSSNWNSQTLVDTLALNGRHQTVQKNGQTIYIYENEGTNAAWVNGGVRYDLTGNAQLSKNEVISIATSL